MKNQKGFTLVEIMVVVAILGILSAIAIPNFKKYRQKARDNASRSKSILNEKSKKSTVTQQNFSDTITCVDGYKFVRSYPSPSQMLDDKGRGIKCSDH